MAERLLLWLGCAVAGLLADALKLNTCSGERKGGGDLALGQT